MNRIIAEIALDKYIEENHPWFDWIAIITMALTGLSLVVSIVFAWFFLWWWKMSLCSLTALGLFVFIYRVMVGVYFQEMISRNRARNNR